MWSTWSWVHVYGCVHYVVLQQALLLCFRENKKRGTRAKKGNKNPFHPKKKLKKGACSLSFPRSLFRKRFLRSTNNLVPFLYIKSIVYPYFWFAV